MNKEIADLICSLIVLGYSRDIKNPKFEYHDDKDYEAYNSVKEKFKHLGVEIEIGKSIPKSNFPLIIAKDKKTFSIGENIQDTEKGYAKSLEKLTNEKLYGAYIGMYYAVDKIILVGASDLKLYSPKYREVSQSKKDEYDAAKSVANKVIELLKNYSNKKYNGVNIITHDLNETIKENYKNGHLFKSYHGMISAMCNYHTSVANYSIYEIAYSEGTSKVSSCFPCETFMRSNEKPASSVHLGKGDNWNIPDNKGGDYLRPQWNKNIKKWYTKGYELFKESKPNGILLRKLDGFIESNTGFSPNMFLEALTFTTEESFNSSFTERIKRSFV